METNYEYNAENFDEILSRLQSDEADLVSNFSDTNFEREFFNNSFSDIENLRLEELNSTNSGFSRSNDESFNNSSCCGNSDDDTFLSNLENNINLTGLNNLENNINLTGLNSLGNEFDIDSLSCRSNEDSCSGVVNSRECFERGLRQGLEQGFVRGFRRGCQQGRESGLREGFTRGLERGLSRAQELARASFERGFRCGFERGFRAGYQKGFRDGCRAGFERGARVGFRRGYERAVRDILRSIRENFGSGSNCSCTASNTSLATNSNWRSC